MEYGIVTTSAVPMRAAPSEGSEMVSQLLWGETFRTEERQERWLLVRANADHCLGWINPRMVQLLDDARWEREAAMSHCLCTAALSVAVNEKSGEPAFIPQGAILYCYNDVAHTFALLDQTYKLLAPPEPLAAADKRGLIAGAAMRMLNAPYLWGGRTALGIDCSGLTQLAYRVGAGVMLPRNAAQQAEKGEPVGFIESAQPADLAFFSYDDSDDKITHTGLLLGERKILHASGFVHIDTIDNEGIFSKKLNRYTHKLRQIKSIV